MAYLNDRVLDAALAILDVEAIRIDICSSEPATYTAATSTLSLGNKTSFAVGSPADKSGGGREVTTTAFTNGTVTASGTATHWGTTDTTNSRLLATNSLTASQAVVNGNSWSCAAFAILGIADGVSA